MELIVPSTRSREDCSRSKLARSIRFPMSSLTCCKTARREASGRSTKQHAIRHMRAMPGAAAWDPPAGTLSGCGLTGCLLQPRRAPKLTLTPYHRPLVRGRQQRKQRFGRAPSVSAGVGVSPFRHAPILGNGWAALGIEMIIIIIIIIMITIILVITINIDINNNNIIISSSIIIIMTSLGTVSASVRLGASARREAPSACRPRRDCDVACF